MDIAELIWIFIIMYVLYRLLFAPAKPKQQQRYDVPSEPSYEEEETATQTRGDILDEMRTIFGEKTTTKKTEPHSSTSPPRQPEAQQKSKYDAYTGADFVDSRKIGAEAEKALKDVTLESRALKDERESRKDAFDFLYQPGEIRKGIIISQVLGKPKSRKRHNI